MGPEALQKLLKSLPPPYQGDEVLVGLDAIDDAGVYRINEEQALVQTIDFFTPIVDDPRDFGRIAAANSLSDIYAMGGLPVTALNVAGFPSEKIPLHILGEILRGGQEKVEEAGAFIIGGHTVEDQEPKYGLAALGMVHPQKIIRKGGARPGDLLIMTKPVGGGILTTGIKKGLVSERAAQKTTEIMAALNAAGARILNFERVNAMTDITGFGLLGHLWEMLQAGQVAARLQVSPDLFLEGSQELAHQEVVPGGTRSNREYLQKNVSWGTTAAPEQFLLSDAMTSGGLLAAAKPEFANAIIRELKEDEEVPGVFIVGEIVEGEPHIFVT